MADYPGLWRRGLIQARIRERAGHRCEHCGMVFRQGTNLAVSAKRYHKKKGWMPMVGTVHHIDGDKSNCAYRNLVYLCQRCHMYVQYRWQPGAVLPVKWGGVPSWITKRGLAYREPAQLRLF